MLPSTVGEWRKFLANYPDEMKFDVEVNCFSAIGTVSLEVKKRQIGYDGTKTKPIMGEMMILAVDVED